MAKIDYEFDQGNGEKSRAGIYFRLAIIFLLVAGLTAGIIWFLVPKSAEGKPAAPVSPKTEVVPSEQENGGTLPSENGKQPAETTPTPAVTETPLPVTENPAQEGEPQATVEPPPTEETPTLIPEKDKPWIGDPVIDRADVPKTVIPADVRPALDADFNRVEQALNEKNYRAAATEAGNILSAATIVPYSTEWRQAAALLTEANLAAFTARAPIEGETVRYTAKPGDSYSRLAAKNHTTIEAIKHYNQIAEDDDNLRISQQLLIQPGPWKIEIRKGARILELYNRDRLYAVFDVGLGRLGKTPAASFVISSKLRNPDWYSPDGKVIRYSDPDNPLGTRFLKLAPTGSPDRPLLGYGIHGTRDDSDITRSLSNGCIRMRNADVETLYIIVPGRTPVEIVE